MAGSAQLTFNSATRNSVTFSYGGTGWYVPSNGTESSVSWGSWSSGDTSQTRTGTSTQNVYDDANDCTTKWTWTFTGGNGGSSSTKEGTKTISGFNAGSKCTVSGTLSAKRTSKILTRTYSQTRTRTKTEIKDEEGKGTGTYEYGSWVEGSKSLVSTSSKAGNDYNLGTSNSSSLTFYTRPAEFTWGVTPAEDVSIYRSLTYSKWNELMDKAVQRYNWKHCQPNETGTPKSTGQNHVSSGALVTAAVYNAGAALCEINTRVTAASSTTSGTVVYASYFTALSNAVNAS